MKLRPLDDRLVVTPIEREDTTKSGIVAASPRLTQSCKALFPYN